MGRGMVHMCIPSLQWNLCIMITMGTVVFIIQDILQMHTISTQVGPGV